ncbi:hypothetical protein VQ03_09335 [Methylobacterium tarhaniae]|uniref:Uncharacterized protein n=1 Tax=Methylobacterium tarhaniae TaxID=1187852 RepID=A0A0J6TC00_9HYPH|nr:hypothetical protein [Methylobacterium tarhaniae]KMO43138.1 hypothetical protein VQ03_09335 [Methylobacterium tarhaniae]
MTGEELHALGTRVWGHGYQARIAAGLKVDVRTVRRWTKGESPVPAGAAAEVRALVAEEDERRRLESEAYAFAAPRVDAILAEALAYRPADVLAGIVARATEHMRDGAGPVAATETLRGAIKALRAEGDA